MSVNKITSYLKYANVQMAAEALFGIQPTDKPGAPFVGLIDLQDLLDGNGRSSKFTQTQAAEFKDDWKVLEHISNTTTGFSGTLFECLRDVPERGLKQGQLVMSIRSTEFIDDAIRDSKTNELEIRKFGWAFGQVADMMAWYDKLDADPTKIGGRNVTVTGYSLGGHLATAFNAVMVERKQGWRIDQTYTFNGAGVGEVKTGHTLTQALTEFNAGKGDGANASYFKDSGARQIYLDAKALLGSKPPTDVNISKIKIGIDNAISAVPAYLPGTAARIEELTLLKNAVLRMEDVNKEADRVIAGISSGGTSGSAQPTKKENIAQLQLDYQIAVGRAGELTNSLGDFNGAWAAISDDGQRRVLVGASPITDVFGAPLPSMVTNSQIHYGTRAPVYIEDQPLLRGDYVFGVYESSQLLKGEVRLLNNNFSNNDFGDTHSLVLLVDSLSVQDTLARIDPRLSVSTINTLFKDATNRQRKTVVGGQGEAEADVLENIVNGLGKMLGIAGWKELKADPSGGTWANIDDPKTPNPNYTDRERFHANLKLVNEALVQKSLVPNSSGVLVPTVKVRATDVSTGGVAREDFGAMVALLNMSPVVITAANSSQLGLVENAFKADWSSEHAKWKTDRDMSAEDVAAGKQTYTDAYLRARAELIAWKGMFNEDNLAYNKTFGTMATTVPIPDPVRTKIGPLLGINGDHVYTHKASQLVLDIDGVNPGTTDKHYVTFGNTAAETLSGGGIEDRLFGGAGNDVLKGQAGNDYLEGNEGNDTLDGGTDNDILLGGIGNDELTGGKGNDTLKGGDGTDIYEFDLNAGFGRDTIVETDGLGKIDIAGIGMLDGKNAKAVQGQKDAWLSNDGKVSYTQVPLDSSKSAYQTGLLITFAGKPKDSILIEGWTPARNLGIVFDTTPAPVIPSNPYVGDFAKKLQPNSSDPSQGDEYVGAPGSYASAGSKPGEPDRIGGSNGADKIEGLGGNDALAGFDGDDFLDGGAGDDYLVGGLGRDTLIGGDGRDYLLGSGIAWGANPRYSKQVNYTPPPADATDITLGFGWAAYKRPLPGDQSGQNLKQLVIAGLSSGTMVSSVYPDDAGNVIDGGKGNDVISAGTGNDTVHGGADDDEIFGLDLQDVLFGDDGNDLIFGDGSSVVGDIDYLPDSLHGADIISGGNGNDLLYGQGQDDQLYGGDGDDKLWGDGLGADLSKGTPYAIQGNDTLEGGAGKDELVGGGRDDQLWGGSGDDKLWGDGPLFNAQGKESYAGAYHGKDYLDGEEGDDGLVGGGQDDTLIGGEGNDNLWGDASEAGMKTGEYGKDLLDGGSGNDALQGGGLGDTLFGGSGDDNLEGDGQFVLVQDQGDDYLDGGAGNDYLAGNGGNDSLLGGAGNDFLDGGAGDDYLEGGQGADLLKGGGGNDTYLFDDEDIERDASANLADSVDDNEGVNTLILEGASLSNLQVGHLNGNASTVGISTGENSLLMLMNGAAGVNNTIMLADGQSLKTNELIGQFADTSDGGAFTAMGGTGGSQEFAMAGRSDDRIATQLAKATLSGGRGNDTLEGAGAANTYLYAAGDGNDIIKDGSVANGSLNALGASTLQFGKGIAQADIWLSAEKGATGGSGNGGGSFTGRYLVVNVGGGTSTVPIGRIVIDGFDFDNPNVPLSVSTLQFDNGSQVKLADLLTSQGVRTTGTAESEAIQGIWRAETLSGGAGDDALSGAAGGDTYRWGLGEGKDVLIENSLSANAAAEVDTLQLLGTLAPADLTFSRAGDDLLIRSKTTADQIVVRGQFNASARNQGIDKVVFASGGAGTPVWTRADILNNLVPVPMSDSDDVYVGSSAGDTIDGLGGNDTLSGLAGNDSLTGGPGNDSLLGGDGNDTLRGGDGANYLSGGNGDDKLVFARTVAGGGGGAGSDTLEGGAGNDTYQFTQWPDSTGAAWVMEDVNAAGIDTIELPAGTLLSNVVFTREVNHSAGFDRLVIKDAAGTSAGIVLEGYFWFDPAKSGVENIRLGDGSVLNRAQVIQLTRGVPIPTAQDDTVVGYQFNDVIDGAAGNDSINGSLGNDTLSGGLGDDTLFGNLGDDSLSGGDGNDQLLGSVGNDTLDGGLGNDLLIGGEGSDTYLFNKTSGKDILWINRAGNNPLDADRIVFDASVLPSQLKFDRQLDSLVIRLDAGVAGGNMQITLADYFQQFDAAGKPIQDAQGNPVSDLKEIKFLSNNTTWTPMDIAAKVALPTRTVTTSNGIDTLLSSESAGLAADIENLTATGGFDLRLVGNAGNNVITGNAGNNSLNGFFALDDPDAWVNWPITGRPANDFFSTMGISQGNGTPGADTLVGGKGDDTYFVNGGEGSASGVGQMPSLNGNDTVVELANEGTDTVVTSNYFETLTANVENLIALNTFNLSDASGRIAHVYTGNGLNNRIDATRTGGLVRIDGGAGADTMYGSAQGLSDSTIYMVDNPGDVVIELAGGSSITSLGDKVESSIDYTLGAGIEDLTLTGTAAIKGVGNDQANYLIGNGAANTLEGLAGNDTVDGGLGNDIYLYGAGDGVDTLLEAVADTNASKLNVLRFKPGIASTGVVLKQVGNDLDVVVGGESQKVVVKGFFSGSALSTTSPLQRIEFDGGVAWDLAKIQSLLKPNTAPTLKSPLADWTFKQGDAINLTLPANAFADADAGDVLSYRASLSDGSALPNWLNFNPATRVLSGQAPGNWVGSLSLKVIATDKSGASVSDAFELAVAIENQNLTGTSGSDVLNGYGGNDTLSGADGDDWLFGGDGQDSLLGGAGRDVLSGDAGQDTLWGGTGGDTLLGGDGDDVLKGDGDGDNLTGGLGNDTLDGGAGNDTYFFSKGDGQDVIAEAAPDASAGKLNTLVMRSGIADADVSVKKVGQDLEVSLTTGTDKVTVKGFFAGTGSGDPANPIQRIHFEDSNKIWDLAKINSLLTGQNTAPQIAQPLLDQAVKQGAAFSYSIPANTFVDNDAGDELTYSVKLADMMALPPWLTFNPTTRTFSGTAPTSDAGTLNIKVSATDKSGNTVSDVFDLAVTAENRTLTGAAINDVLTGYSGNDTLYGLAGNDTLMGNDGDDRLDGGAGQDSMEGGAGNDTYVFDSVNDIANDDVGIDTIESNVSLTLPTRIENLVLTGTAALVGTGNDLSNLIVGNAGDNRLDGGVAPTSWMYPANDTLRGGAGNDTYVITPKVYTTTTVEELPGEGIDTIEFTSSSDMFTMPNQVENLVLKGTSMVAEGNDLDNVITGNDSNNIISGGEGADTLFGLGGDDILEGGLEFGTDGDVMDGGLGDDTYRYQTGSGQDTVVEATPDARVGKMNTLFIYGRGAASEVISASLKRRGSDLEVWIGTGADKITVKSFFAGTGPDNPLNPVQKIEFANGLQWDIPKILSLVTTAPANTAPVLAAALVDQSVKQGSVLNYTIPAGAFNDADAGDALSYKATLTNGGALPSWLTFNPNTRAFTGTAPVTSGITSVKVLVTDKAGATASDVFDVVVSAPVANTAPKLVTALADQAVKQGAAVSYTVPAGAFADADAGDVLTYRATLADGRARPVWLTFNPGTRAFTGTAPTATVGATSIKVTATDKAGASISDVFDVVVSSENKTFTGTAAAETFTGYSGNDTLNGAGGADTLVGNAGNDRLNGGADADSMIGGAGDDTYVVDNVNDKTIEVPGAGIDVVESSISWTLASNVEHLVLTGSAAINGTGNALANGITGNSGNNLISGDLGHDTLNGAQGADTLDGGAGNDLYLYTKGDGLDTIQEATADTSTTKLNVLRFRNTIAATDVTFKKVGTDLQVLISGGATDRITVKGFYASNGAVAVGNPLQRIEFSDGTQWDTAAIVAQVPAQQRAADGAQASAVEAVDDQTGLVEGLEFNTEAAGASEAKQTLARQGAWVDAADRKGPGVDSGPEGDAESWAGVFTDLVDEMVAESLDEATPAAAGLSESRVNNHMLRNRSLTEGALGNAEEDHTVDLSLEPGAVDEAGDAVAGAHQAAWAQLRSLMLEGERRGLPERVGDMRRSHGWQSSSADVVVGNSPSQPAQEVDHLAVMNQAMQGVAPFPGLQSQDAQGASSGAISIEGQVHALLDAMAAFAPAAPGETSWMAADPSTTTMVKREIAVQWNA